MWHMNKNALKQRIVALANRAVAHHDSLGKGKTDFDAWEKVNAELEAELSAINEAAGKGLVVGRVLSFGVADGNACYIVTKIRKNDVVVEWVPLGDGYMSQAVGLNADGTEYIVLRSTAQAYAGF
jgi:hypothetical protein